MASRTKHAIDAPGPRAEGVERVVSVGSSAGGLEALQEFLGPIPPETTSAFVVAQHLSPAHPSMIVDLLARAVALTVVEAEDGMRLRPGVVAVTPPDRDVTVDGERIHLREPAPRFGPSPSIDLLFTSLAEHWGEHATAVVLSGTGSDGAHGLRTVKGAGGLTMVQSPESAGFDGMPRAAIALGGADLIAEPSVLGRRLADLSPIGSAQIGSAVPAAAATMLSTITTQLRRTIGIDFSGFKESTLRRQIQRRMALRQVTDLDSYFRLLSEEPDEAHALASNLLVTVTSFFRDPEAFDALAPRLAERLTAMPPGEVLRVWVPGCATGEEAYTIAMLVGEALNFPHDLNRFLKIYATDLDETSLGIARRATYPESAIQRIPEHLRERYTRRVREGMQIADVIRECVVFASHDLGSDPPFPRIDLISCRNTLIYFAPPLQQQVFTAFRFALNPGGLLFLGAAENLQQRTPGFVALDADHRIFLRELDDAERRLAGRPATRERAPRIPAPVTRPATPHDAALEHQVALLEAVIRFTDQAFLVLDDAHNVVQVVGDVSPYCRLPAGRMTAEVSSILRPELQDEARALLLLCRADRAPITGQLITGLGRPILLRASPVHAGDADFTVLSFAQVSDEPDGGAPAPARPESFGREIARMERELLATQDTLRRSLVELQVTNEELEASTEELQASSEELQASNEELQASNEELGTLNQQLRQQSTELVRLNNDLENIQASLSQGMIIIDREALVQRFTPLAVRLFALVNADLGQPLWSAPTTMPVPDLPAAVAAVLAGEPRRNLQATDGTTSYLIQVLPYREQNADTLGAIITLTDVSEMVALRRTAEGALAELQGKSELLQEQAAYDFTTGLLNRGYFSLALERELDRAGRASSPLALAWIDLDRFKEVNDEFGHEAGDQALKVTAERLHSIVRGTDIIGRLGGDEFGVVITGYEDAGELDAILERLVLALRQPFEIDGKEARVGASIGVALFPKDDQSVQGLLNAADAAMYTVKALAGDAYGYFDQSMNVEATERRRTRQQIDAAIASSDFVLHYQPIVGATDGRVWGVEALVRWISDDRIIEAEEFIPFCEASGQIRTLGRLTLGLLQDELRTLREAGHGDMPVCLNMSASQLEDPKLLDRVEGWPSPIGLQGIVIEVVESVFLPDHRFALDTLERLINLGARVAIDDFGSGYSNIRLLEHLDPDFIKLDRTFLSGRHSEVAQTSFIRLAAELTHVLGAKLVAEGVETDEQLALVRASGADLAQGYAIAHPMALDELLAWLAANPHTA